MKNIILKAPTHIELTITERCNHKCRHCYNEWRNKYTDNSGLSTNQREYLLSEFVKNQITYVTLTGGEPLMDIDNMFWFIDRLKKENIGVGLNTNLSLMTEDIAKQLVTEFKWKNTILTSLPGFTPQQCDEVTQVKGSFYNIERGIDICTENGIPVGVNVVITKDNINMLPQIYDFLKCHDIAVLALTRVVPTVYNALDPQYMLDQTDINRIVDCLKIVKKEFGIRVTSLCSIPFCLIHNTDNLNFLSTKCAAGIIGCCINTITGNVTPCAHNERSYGNIYESSLSKIWEAMYEWRSGKYMSAECQQCSMLPACGGDCRLNTIRVKEKAYKLDGTCKIKFNYHEQENFFNQTSRYCFNQKTILREEKFGAVVSLGVNEFYVTHPVYKLLCILQSYSNFGWNEIKRFCVVNQPIIKLINQLISADIIYKL